jgi:hypothetical protein
VVVIVLLVVLVVVVLIIVTVTVVVVLLLALQLILNCLPNPTSCWQRYRCCLVNRKLCLLNIKSCSINTKSGITEHKTAFTTHSKMYDHPNFMLSIQIVCLIIKKYCSPKNWIFFYQQKHTNAGSIPSRSKNLFRPSKHSKLPSTTLLSSQGELKPNQQGVCFCW